MLTPWIKGTHNYRLVIFTDSSVHHSMGCAVLVLGNTRTSTQLRSRGSAVTVLLGYVMFCGMHYNRDQGSKWGMPPSP